MSSAAANTSNGKTQSSSTSNTTRSSSVSTKPIHPVTLSSFAPTGCELSTWAYITSPRPPVPVAPAAEDSASSSGTDNGNDNDNNKDKDSVDSLKYLPNLVTAQANSLRIYVVDPKSGTLLMASSYEHLAGTIVSLDVIPCSTGNSSGTGVGTVRDGLLLGFAGHPRMSIVYPSGNFDEGAAESGDGSHNEKHGSGSGSGSGSSSYSSSGWSGVLTASSILDLTPALIERCKGSTTPLEQDLNCAVTWNGKIPTVSVILGGGVAVATFQLPRSNHNKGSSTSTNGGQGQTSSSSWWRVASEPYFLPLSHLSNSLHSFHKSTSSTVSSSGSQANNKYTKTNPNAMISSAGKVSHGFGDIISSAFLIGYKEPVLTLLHSNPCRHGGRTCPGRLGLAHHSSSTRTPLTLTAVSISIHQNRSVVLWTLRDVMPSDAVKLYQHPRGGVLVLCVNEILYVDCSGKVQCCTAVNGWVRSTASSALGLRSKKRSAGGAGPGGGIMNSGMSNMSMMNTGIVQPNPSPLTKLSIQLDASRLVFVNKNLALLSLRNGSLYSLELHDKKEASFGFDSANSNSKRMCLSLSPVGKKLGALGMISTMCAIPLSVGGPFCNFLDDDSYLSYVKKEALSEGSQFPEEQPDNTLTRQSLSIGLVFAGSRMGDSTLMMYGLKEKVKLVPLEDNNNQENEKAEAVDAAVKEVGRSKRKKEEVDSESESDMNNNNDDNSSKKVRDKKIKISSGGEGENADSKTDFKVNSDNDNSNIPNNDTVAVSDDEHNLSEEEILKREEEALYAPVQSSNDGSDIIPVYDVNDEEEEKDHNNLFPKLYEKQLYRPQIRALSVFQHMKVLDSLTGLGPLGAGCNGPVPCNLTSNAKGSNPNVPLNAGSTMNVHPCGYGSSGGLAVLTSPGLNYGSTIITEADCRGIGSLYHCANFGYIFLAKKEVNGGCIVLKLVRGQGSSKKKSLIEVDLGSLFPESMDNDIDMENAVPTFFNVKDILTRMNILSVREFSSKQNDSELKIMVVVQYDTSYAIIILGEDDEKKLSLDHTHIVGAFDDSVVVERGNLVSVSLPEMLDGGNYSDEFRCLSFGCVWTSGLASVFSISLMEGISWEVREIIIQGSDKITAVDTFSIADNIFTSKKEINDTPMDTHVDEPETEQKEEESANCIFDQDDVELYGEEFVGRKNNPQATTYGQEVLLSNITPSRYNTLGGYISGASLSDTNMSIIAISDRSGQLQLLDIDKLFKNSPSSLVHQLSREETKQGLVWACVGGCGHGVAHLSPLSLAAPEPNEDDVFVTEIKVFFCGPTITDETNNPRQKDMSILRSLCVILFTNQGDLHLYTGSKSNNTDEVGFKRVALGIVTRRSKEEQRHFNKMKRKGIVVDNDFAEAVFQPRKLHRFFSLSGQDGLFSATSRPLWFVSERGVPSALYHRLRHCAPAGGSPYPVSGFCSVDVDGSKSNFGFITLHERIGRVGSQRITFFNGLSDIFTPHGLLPGGGQFIQKIPLGVTVHKIQFIDNPAVSSAVHPLYVLLVARETESDQSHLNDDGLTSAEREEAKRKKDQEKMQKQVEADLGGFDVEQEWVEEIEREECFDIEKRYGGAPPIPTKTYEIWLVDASDWTMVDTHPLEEHEHAMAMEVMTLSDISESSDNSQNNDASDSSLFLVVGTGIIDHDGEDVSSRGRIVLFNLNRTSTDTEDAVEATMEFLYDKEISIGPVTSLSNLNCEGKSRLVVGAGAEVTLEQWGNGKLLQVGFFHANMHIQDIVLFKNFFLLSDAYDSLHFLVWRESDKSLTLLAKDYEPACVYASGILSRGGAVSFVTMDDRQNVSFYSYAPSDVAARGGNKLVCRADYHLGTQTVGFVSHFCRSSLVVNSATLQSTLVALKQQEPFFGKLDDDQRFGLHYGSTDGTIGCIVPINEDLYWRLTALQSVMSNALESDCSLSRRAWRLYRRTPRRGGCRSNVRKKGVIDGDLIVKFVDLALREQEDLASAIGSTVDLILDNISEVFISSAIV